MRVQERRFITEFKMIQGLIDCEICVITQVAHHSCFALINIRKGKADSCFQGSKVLNVKNMLAQR